jgi:hypothetical protein
MKVFFIVTGFVAVAAASHYLEKRNKQKKEVELGSAVYETWRRSVENRKRQPS